MRTLRLLSILFLGGLLIVSVSYATDKCLTCHKNSNPALYLQWKDSGHGKNGIGCLDCHEAEESDVDAFKHNGETIATLVTPPMLRYSFKSEAQSEPQRVDTG